MSKFKVGDPVKSLDHKYSSAAGWPYGVVSSTEDDLIEVVFGEQESLAHFEDEIELVILNEHQRNTISPHYTTDSTGLSGGLNNYYLVDVSRPQREGQQPYTAECEDIIGALDLNFDEGNIFKAIWRAANARKGNGKAGHVPKYDAEKVYHSAGRILKRNS